MSALSPTPQRAETSQSNAGGARQVIVVVMVNFCTARLTIDCLRTLEPELRAWPGSTVVVADNASPDGSGKAIAEAITANGWTSWAKVLQLDRNGGFAYGNNAVIRSCSDRLPDFFWLLNSDTLVRPGALSALVAALNARPEAGIAGSYLENPDGTQQCSAFRFHTIASELESSARLWPVTALLGRWAVAPPLTSESQPVDWLSGASLFIRREVIRDIGLMDEEYFLYYEETDYCWKARAHRWQSYFVGDSHVVHLVGQSSGIVEGVKAPPRRPRYWFESRRRYFLKNHGWLYAVGADLALALGTAIAGLRGLVQRRPTAVPAHFLYDLARNSAVLSLPKRATSLHGSG